MKCKVCGQELPDRAKFCFACGAPMDDVPAPKKLEEPLEPSLAGGAVPMVPVAPPPRLLLGDLGDRRATRALPSSCPQPV